MIKSEEVDSSSSGYYNRLHQSTSSLHLPPISAPSMLSISSPAPYHHRAEQEQHQQSHPHLHLSHEMHRQLGADEKPNLSYLNRHILSNSAFHNHPMHQDIMLPPSSSSTIMANRPPSIITSTRLQPMPHIHDYGTSSTIKYCSSNGLEILPVQSHPAYVIQQCHPSSPSSAEVGEGGTGSSHVIMSAGNDEPIEINPHHHESILNSVSGSSATNGSSGGQLEVVHYAGASSTIRKKDAASPGSSCSAGSRESASEQPLPSDTTKKTSNTRRPEKPNMSYINMIAMAIKESPDRMLTLNGIYQYLQEK